VSSDELFSRVNIDDFERPWTSEISGFFIDFCNFWLQYTLQEWTAKKWLEIDWQFANRNCYRLSRVLWALAQISCYIRCQDLSLPNIAISQFFCLRRRRKHGLANRHILHLLASRLYTKLTVFTYTNCFHHSSAFFRHPLMPCATFHGI